ncbi:hypothetical protein NQ318_012324 [Aromia moschata]|uniref:Choline transporter-like protein n=1 Tax=Aromia moschata TaxID=1265417 RepID=A0AAV8YKE9_9CUCU|nr:hypothetical protein NQ318_012324 [Aromia moschata]
MVLYEEQIMFEQSSADKCLHNMEISLGNYLFGLSPHHISSYSKGYFKITYEKFQIKNMYRLLHALHRRIFEDYYEECIHHDREGEYEEYSMYATFLVVIITAVCSWSLLGPVQMAVDTMFVCFCEDCIINDGVTKPYFMTRALMEFVDNSKVLFADTIKKKGLPTI